VPDAASSLYGRRCLCSSRRNTCRCRRATRSARRRCAGLAGDRERKQGERGDDEHWGEAGRESLCMTGGLSHIWPASARCAARLAFIPCAAWAGRKACAIPLTIDHQWMTARNLARERAARSGR
jgi:hypothetical protein